MMKYLAPNEIAALEAVRLEVARQARKLINRARYKRRYARYPTTPSKRIKIQRKHRLPTTVGAWQPKPIPLHQPTHPLALLERNTFSPQLLFTLLARALRPGGFKAPRVPKKPAHQGKREMARRVKQTSRST